MKLLKFDTFYTHYVSTTFIEILKWVVFYFFIELIFLFLLDPLGLYIQPLGFELDEIFNIIFIVTMPFLTLYFTESTSGFGCLNGLILYLFLNSDPLNFIQIYFLNDLLSLFIYLTILYEMIPTSESETTVEEEV